MAGPCDNFVEPSGGGRLQSSGVFDRTFMVSATKGDGLQELLDYGAGFMPEGPFLYPEDQVADIPSRLLAAEITREKLYLRLHDELPYASTVTTESWKDHKDGSVRIDQTIFVERESQKGIVIGKGGVRLKHVGATARRQVEALLGTQIYLDLHVRVAKDWQRDPKQLRRLGLW